MSTHALLASPGGQRRAACGTLDLGDGDLAMQDFDARARFGRTSALPAAQQVSGAERAALCRRCLEAIYGRENVPFGAEG